MVPKALRMSPFYIVLVRSFGLACPDSSVLTGTEEEIVVYRERNVTVLANTVTFFHNLTVLANTVTLLKSS